VTPKLILSVLCLEKKKPTAPDYISFFSLTHVHPALVFFFFFSPPSRTPSSLLSSSFSFLSSSQISLSLYPISLFSALTLDHATRPDLAVKPITGDLLIMSSTASLSNRQTEIRPSPAPHPPLSVAIFDPLENSQNLA
jgi:hypothetical protein